MDYYQVLGIKKSARSAEIRQAYRRLALKLHPDQSRNSDSEPFRALQEAYETLSDPQSRKVYDRGLGQDIPIHIGRPSWSDRVAEVRRDDRFEVREIRRKSAAQMRWEDWRRRLWEEFFEGF